jgi:hypothetical protein
MHLTRARLPALVLPALMLTVLTLTVMASACSDGKGSSGTEPSTTSTPPTFCEAARSANAASDVQQQLLNGQDPPPPPAVQAVVEEFGDRFAAMAALAPADIKSDVDVINQTAQQLLTVVRANNYDVGKTTASPDFAALGTTFASDAYQAAQNRFQSYIDSNCAAAPTTTGA